MSRMVLRKRGGSTHHYSGGQTLRRREGRPSASQQPGGDAPLLARASHAVAARAPLRLADSRGVEGSRVLLFAGNSPAAPGLAACRALQQRRPACHASRQSTANHHGGAGAPADPRRADDGTNSKPRWTTLVWVLATRVANGFESNLPYHPCLGVEREPPSRGRHIQAPATPSISGREPTRLRAPCLADLPVEVLDAVGGVDGSGGGRAARGSQLFAPSARHEPASSGSARPRPRRRRRARPRRRRCWPPGRPAAGSAATRLWSFNT